MTSEVSKPQREPDVTASNKSGCSSDATDDPSTQAGVGDGEGKSAREDWRPRAGNPAPASYQHSERGTRRGFEKALRDTGARPDPTGDHVRVIRTALAQGGRAMHELGWTHANVFPERSLDSLVEQLQSLEREADIQNDEAERLHEQLEAHRRLLLFWIEDRMTLLPGETAEQRLEFLLKTNEDANSDDSSQARDSRLDSDNISEVAAAVRERNASSPASEPQASDASQ